jgi:hypothetical protein
MQENAVGCLPVVTGAFLVGVITRDKLSRMGVSPEEEKSDLPVGDPEPSHAACAACGNPNGVRRDLRTGMLFLCSDCAAVMPTTEVPRGN